eukprot:TRINITY_DN102946_c0_g1_i1.p1 TRINITY_DN102946_c0_g1~~TRINITY_DN102946_c0_g1_i1.p1  ORF type:complete len:219 (+),score=27.62 TRINITY_DN102946_c0_g1_i1:32-658(+)
MPLAASASAPTLVSFPESAQPGGPWVTRKTPLEAAGRHVAQPPPNEAAAVAWKARRKATLQGQLGTGNSISSVIQYPCSTRDPNNMCSRYKNHLSAEDRRILRVRVKHHMRGKPSWPDNVYQVEKVLLQSFAKNGELCDSFYSNDDFCEKLLRQAAHVVEGGTFKDAPGHAKLRMKSKNWDESHQNKVTVAAAEILQTLSETSLTQGR